MAINVTTSSEKVTARVADEKVTASVTGSESVSATVTAGFGATGPAGPAGPSGVITVTAPVTNTGSSSAANVGLSIGSSLSVADGSLIVTPGTYATLVGGTVPASQLPSYVDDVLEYANVGSLPTPGESGKIYVALNTGKIYRWSGSAYFEISASPGSTDAVAEGATNLYFTNARARNAFGTGTTGQVITWSGGQWTAATPATYTLPTASSSVLGGVKVGSGITITNGVISASSQYTLPTATDSVLGGVKVGSGVTITDGVISVATNYLPLAGGAMNSGSVVTFSNGTTDSEIGPWGFGVELTGGTNQWSTIEYNAVTVQDGSGTTQITPGHLSMPNGTQVTIGSFDNMAGGANGISLICAVGYELNWQAGHLRNVQVGGDGTPQTIYSDSPLAFPGNGAANVTINATGLTFSDGSTQATAAVAFNQTLNTTDEVGFQAVQANFIDVYGGTDAPGTSINGFGVQARKPGTSGTQSTLYYGDGITFPDSSSQTTAWPGSVDWTTQVDNKPTLFSGSYGDLTGKPTLGTAASQDSSAFAAASHTHDDRYYTETEVDTLLAAKVGTGDASVTNAREWTASTVSQADAEAGTSSTRFAFTPLRVFQAIVAWWAGSSAKTKLDGIASGATANQTDAYLLSRANHTGTQSATTITGLAAVATSGSAADLTGTLSASRLPATAVTAGSYGSSTQVATFTVDSAGRLTAAGSTSIAISAGAVSGLASVATAGTFASLTSKPTTLSGYGITDGVTTTDSRLSDARTPTGAAGGSLAGTYPNPTIATGAFATTADAVSGTSTTAILTPARGVDAVLGFGVFDLGWYARVANGGSGTASGRAILMNSNTTANGFYGYSTFGSPGQQFWEQTDQNGIDFSKPKRFVIRIQRGAGSTNGFLRMTWGKSTSDTYPATLARRGIGFEVRNLRFWLICHNGSSLTQVDTGVDYSAPCEMWCESNGSGTVTLYRNGTQIGTTTGGPTSADSSAQMVMSAEVANGGDASQNQWILQRYAFASLR